MSLVCCIFEITRDCKLDLCDSFNERIDQKNTKEMQQKKTSLLKYRSKISLIFEFKDYEGTYD